MLHFAVQLFFNSIHYPTWFCLKNDENVFTEEAGNHKTLRWQLIKKIQNYKKWHQNKCLKRENIKPLGNQKVEQVHALLCHFLQHHPPGQPLHCSLLLHVTGFTSYDFHTHCSSATNSPPWFHILISEQPFEFAGPLKSSCYRSG
jgi:hypothetical protein